jgi:hypothetical protein
MTYSYFLIHNVSGITSGKIKKKGGRKSVYTLQVVEATAPGIQGVE